MKRTTEKHPRVKSGWRAFDRWAMLAGLLGALVKLIAGLMSLVRL